MDRCCKIWSCSSSWRCCLHICNCYTKATLSYLDRVIVSSTTSTICSWLVTILFTVVNAQVSQHFQAAMENMLKMIK
ncbi:hypothetical protein Scep_026780 [Stephania cephalantha]|uniref:Uncharacterized protein n=1 Tax=Stephania cephalantha TaxID=152367 RepID=A0AAP0HSX0_9MAGN